MAKSKLTITESLAEIKTIKARIESKRNSTMRYLARDARLRDPLEADGGSVAFIAKERQAILDLEERIVSIRTAIQKSNLSADITIQGVKRSVAEWLTWRREIASGHATYIESFVKGIEKVRREVAPKGMRVTENNESKEPNEVIVAVGEKALAEESEHAITVINELDGRLSLANATTTITV